MKKIGRKARCFLRDFVYENKSYFARILEENIEWLDDNLPIFICDLFVD